MSTVKTHAPGQFCWVDLTAKDMEDAVDFYARLFGWTHEIQPTHGGPPYAQLSKDGEVVAGIGQMSAQMIAGGAPSVWNSYVAVEDCAAVEAAAKRLGATVVFSTMKVFDAGALAFLQDPTGAVFALWQAGQHCGATRVNEPGSFCWNELATTDLSTSREFYGALFGWRFESRDTSAPTEVSVIDNGGRDNGHMLQMTQEWAGIPSHWGVYFAVDDCDRTVAMAEAMGGKVRVPPMDIPPGRFALLEDRGGAKLTVIRLNQAS